MLTTGGLSVFSLQNEKALVIPEKYIHSILVLLIVDKVMRINYT